MHHIIVRCEDHARVGAGTAALLEGAKLVHLQQLAQAGAAGLIRSRTDRGALARLDFHRALFGLGAQEGEALPALCYAAHMNLPLVTSETAWCCELVTQRDGIISDATAGQISAQESQMLIRGLNDQFGSETRRWEVGQGPHHLFITRDPAFMAEGGGALRSPELLVNQGWASHLPKSAMREPLQMLFKQAATFLESHPVNRVRVDLGENPGNMIWLWGAAESKPQPTLMERTRLSGAMISNHFPMRGFAQCLGLSWNEGPSSWEELPLQRLTPMLLALSERHDLVYVHLRVESADPVERLCAMERMDQLVLKPLTEQLPTRGPWRLAVVVDDRGREAVPVIAIGTGLPQQPVMHFTAEACAQSPLQFEEGTQLFSWFTQEQVRGER